MISLNNIIAKLIGDVDSISSEKLFMTVTCLVVSLFLLVLSILHLIMGLKPEPVFIAGGSSVLIFVLYLFLRNTTCLFYPKLILSTVGLIMLDLTWYYKFLSQGPVLFYMFIFGALIIWVWEGKILGLLLAVYFLNFFALYSIEKHVSLSVLNYPDTGHRLNDIYVSIALYSVLLIVLLYIVKKEFIRQKNKAQRSEKLKSSFLANMSHEIRTPVNSIVGFSQLMEGEKDANNTLQYLSIIKRSSFHLLQLIDDILDLSRIEAGDMQLRNSSFRVKDLPLELETEYSIDLMNRGKGEVVLNIHLTDDDLCITSDRVRIKQILSNLVTNSIKFTQEGGITISCSKETSTVVFSVSDTGLGINPENLDRILDPFVKFDVNELNKEGTGIGLSIVSKLVSMLNGKLYYNSKPGHGSVFSFVIPDDIVCGPVFSEKDEKACDDSVVSHPRMPVMIVEDDKYSVLLIRSILDPMNLQIYHVSNGIDAVDMIRLRPEIKLVLMDLKLPGLDGYSATSEIKRLRPEVIVIGQSAYAMTGDREKAIASGCDDYITKPIDPVLLRKTIISYSNMLTK